MKSPFTGPRTRGRIVGLPPLRTSSLRNFLRPMQIIVAATILTAFEVGAAFGLSRLLRRVLVDTR
jgi:hypothetical protein